MLLHFSAVLAAPDCALHARGSRPVRLPSAQCEPPAELPAAHARRRAPSLLLPAYAPGPVSSAPPAELAELLGVSCPRVPGRAEPEWTAPPRAPAPAVTAVLVVGPGAFLPAPPAL